MLRAEDEWVLESVGVSEAEEATYRRLLEQPGSTLPEIARSLGVSPRQARATTGQLERKGLITRTAGRVSRFVPAPPEVAIEVLILNRQKDLERARLAAAEMAEIFRASRSGATSPLEVVEVAVGREAILQRFDQLHESAREQMRVFDKPPYARPPVGPSEVELKLLARGVACRAIYDSEALAVPGILGVLRELHAAGEQSRVLPALPLKLAMADDHLGLIPLSLDEPGTEGALLIHPSPLLAALSRLFETLWEQAARVDLFGPTPVAGQGRRPGPTLDNELIVLLIAGLKDQAIARQLGVSHRTVVRKVSQLMSVFGAQTRFQAGWFAAQRALGSE